MKPRFKDNDKTLPAGSPRAVGRKVVDVEGGLGHGREENGKTPIEYRARSANTYCMGRSDPFTDPPPLGFLTGNVYKADPLHPVGTAIRWALSLSLSLVGHPLNTRKIFGQSAIRSSAVSFRRRKIYMQLVSKI